MRTNGTLQYQITEGGGLNELGEPLPVKTIWSRKIGCMIQTNKHAHTGTYQDGKFTVESYEVEIEGMGIETGRIKLCRYGKELGEFVVQDVQPFPGVGRTKIIV